ncbi:MAG TPA: winged helix-turn-helix transcriptional regulator [Pseudonocardia sp.]
MAGARAYRDPCGIARALDRVGERWALLVVRDLLLGPKRFGQLRHGLRGISPNVLTQRLRELEEAGVVTRRTVGPPPGSAVYELTARGRELQPVLVALGRWGSATLPEDGELGTDALVVALVSTLDPERAAGLRIGVQLRFGGAEAAQDCWLRIADGSIDARRGRLDHPDVTLDTDPATLRAVVFGGRPLDDAMRAGALAVSGAREVADRLVTLFPARRSARPRSADPSAG